MIRKLKDVCVSDGCSVREAMSCIDKTGCGIALVVDDSMHLIGTISDGDYRRAVMDGCDLEMSANALIKQKDNTLFAKPITAKKGSNSDEWLDIMRMRGVRQIIVVDDDERVVDFARLDDLVPERSSPLRAIVIAGGFGLRMRPLTDNLPKPMLPVGGKPVMEHVVDQLKNAGITHISVATHYKPEQIENYFGDGSSFGVKINYINEDEPLGTGGAVGLLPQSNDTTLVVNGDILTQVNFRSMMNCHQEHKADMTVAVRRYSMQVPFGVVECDGHNILSINEKPSMNFLVNAGFYLIEPSVYQFIPRGKRFDMTDLIGWLRKANRPIVSFPVIEYWLDIGQHADYLKAQQDVKL